MSCSRPPIARVRRCRFDSPSALADLHGPQRDAARVLLGVGVARAELDRERADVRAEEALLGVHELDRVEVAGERPRLGAAREVERDRDADDEDAVELEPVAEPPAELDVGQRERRDERRPSQTMPTMTTRSAIAPREQEGAERPHREDRRRARGRPRAAPRASGCSRPGRRGGCSGRRAPSSAEPEDQREHHALEHEQRLHAAQRRAAAAAPRGRGSPRRRAGSRRR